MPANPALHDTSPLATMTRFEAAASATLTSGTIYAVRARPVVSQLVTVARVAPSAGTWTITGLRVGIWDEAGVKLAETSDMSAGIANTALQVGSLLQALQVYANRDYFVGVGIVGSSVGNLRGASGLGSLTAAPPQLSRTVAGWDGSSALPNLGVSASAVLPWIDLN